MKHAQKMYLLWPQQLSRLTRPSASIRQTAENDLDERMRALLNQPGMSSYEKIKRYDALLQRYLSLMKQGRMEEQKKQSPPLEEPPADAAQPSPATEGSEEDEVVREVKQSLPARDRKKAEYILRKLSGSPGDWNAKGEFVYRGRSIKGSHMMDLFQNLSLPYRAKKPRRPPPGWNGFLNVLAELNIPFSSVGNPTARDQYRRRKTGEEDRGAGAWVTSEEERDPPRHRLPDIKPQKSTFILSPRWITLDP